MRRTSGQILGIFIITVPISSFHEIKRLSLLQDYLTVCFIVISNASLLRGLNEMLLRMAPKDLVLCKMCYCGCENVECYAVRA